MGAYSYCPHCDAGLPPATLHEMRHGQQCHGCERTLPANRTLEDIVEEQADMIADLQWRMERIERSENL